MWHYYEFSNSGRGICLLLRGELMKICYRPIICLLGRRIRRADLGSTWRTMTWMVGWGEARQTYAVYLTDKARLTYGVLALALMLSIPSTTHHHYHHQQTHQETRDLGRDFFITTS